MMYRGWTIRSYKTFLGYVAQYTSPFGQTQQTSACFPTEENALAYARAIIDSLQASGWIRVGSSSMPTAKSA